MQCIAQGGIRLQETPFYSSNLAMFHKNYAFRRFSPPMYELSNDYGFFKFTFSSFLEKKYSKHEDKNANKLNNYLNPCNFYVKEVFHQQFVVLATKLEVYLNPI